LKKLELPPDAKMNFNEKADFLLSELVPVPSKSVSICRDSLRPNFLFQAILEKEMI
jgi:hypothetical protein